MNATTPGPVELDLTPQAEEEVEIEEVSPLDMIEALEEDLKVARSFLRRIANINPAHFQGGINNKNFGLKGLAAFEQAKQLAAAGWYETDRTVIMPDNNTPVE